MLRINYRNKRKYHQAINKYFFALTMGPNYKEILMKTKKLLTIKEMKV